ncbi:hypothetical protein KQX54_005435 [Cotesia glomerata]|uniref:Uncharacterized protein n=1 Tax=Cotesia glomerata TaxID=32391 RepID=A0AAV7I5Q4_COTGL|nr:hypothetical protein KQX54_005435 [Cotesia glomerata]
MKLRRRCIQTLGVSVKQLRRKLVELGARILHVHQTSKSSDMALMVASARTSRVSSVWPRMRFRGCFHCSSLRSSCLGRDCPDRVAPVDMDFQIFY